MKPPLHNITAIVLVALITYVAGYAFGVNKKVSYSLPPAFPCHGENCHDSYDYHTTYARALANAQAALDYQMNK